MLYNRSPGELVVEPVIDLVDDTQVGQQCRNIASVDIAPRRHDAAAALAEPITVEIEVVRYGYRSGTA
jgi:hypothetical protein